ncbi:LysM peptidoglycan-binding domain-containing protein [Lacipirellula sp.]|uniref:LysM peptidoglycan-binding domain-containing protein n=1 Tax=Lacipirellula sp. TaxID=2691419 RepID=UPI003D0A3431
MVPRTPKLIAACAVLGVGVCLAWPWRRDRPTNVVPAASPATVAPNATAAPSKDLMAASPTDVSPAALAELAAPPEQNPFASVSLQAPQLHTTAKPPVADGVAPLPFALAPLPEIETVPTERTHVVHAGDSLESLAKRYLGDEARALELFDLNREVLENPHLLPIGAELAIPANSETAATAQAH